MAKLSVSLVTIGGVALNLVVALAAIGAQQVMNVSAFLNPLGHRAPTPYLRVIRVWGNHQNPLRGFFHPQTASNSTLLSPIDPRRPLFADSSHSVALVPPPFVGETRTVQSSGET